jgi:gliding motility-associated-like protein
LNSGANQTQLLNNAGQATLIIANVMSTKVITLVSVAFGNTTACVQNVNQTITITVSALPTATLSANPTVICSNQTTTLSFVGTPNATVFYTTNNTNSQSVTLNAAGNAVVSISNLASTTSYQLVSVVLAATNCSQLLLGSATVAVNQTPIGSFTGNLSYCSGETTLINLQSDIAGTTFSWTTIQNNTTGASPDSGTQIIQNLETISSSNGSVIYIVTPVFNGCSGTPFSITVTVNPLPIPDLQDGVICIIGSNPTLYQPYTLDTTLNITDYSFQWFFEGNPISNASGNTYQVNQIGEYSVMATNITTGCDSEIVFATVSATEIGESLVIQQSEAFSSSPTITVTVIGGSGPFLYQIDDSNFQTSNIFLNVITGTHSIRVIDQVYCTNLTATVTILNYPKFFTPNGDGYHDTWNINGLNANAKIMIYDRYGKLMKQISTNGAGWDGTFNGHMLFSSDYWFTVTYLENGVEKLFKAHFTLKR